MRSVTGGQSACLVRTTGSASSPCSAVSWSPSLSQEASGVAVAPLRSAAARAQRSLFLSSSGKTPGRKSPDPPRQVSSPMPVPKARGMGSAAWQGFGDMPTLAAKTHGCWGGARSSDSSHLNFTH